MNRDRRRSSIHDITSLNNGDVSSHQAPISRQVNTSPAWPAPAMEPSVKHRRQTHVPGLAMYGRPPGHPVAPPGHMASAVGTPVMLPPPGHPPYVVPVAYPLAPQTLHQ